MNIIEVIGSVPKTAECSAIFIFDENGGNLQKVDRYLGLNIDGDCGRVFIQRGTTFSNTRIYFRSSGGTAFFCKSKYKITGLTVYLNHMDSLFFVGEDFSCVKAECYLYEGKNIYIGKDNQWSFGIQVRNSDAHAIVSLQTGRCINKGEDVYFGEHVWVASNASILKGGGVGNNSIIATGAVVTKKFEEQNVILGGVPAHIIRKNVTWQRCSPSEFTGIT